MQEFQLLTKDDIEVKVKQVKQSGAVALLYKTARVDMDKLDKEVGAENWQCDYREIKGNLYCGIGIRIGIGDGENEWVWKWDCGIESREDGDGNEKKGEASDAFKRAGTKWGIGRELYTAPFIYLRVETEPKAGGRGYELKDPYARFSVKEICYEGRAIASVTIVDNNGNVVYGKINTVLPAKATPEINPPKSEVRIAESGRKLTVKQCQLASKCPNDRIIMFMNAIPAKSYDELTEQQYGDLIAMVKAYKPPKD